MGEDPADVAMDPEVSTTVPATGAGEEKVGKNAARSVGRIVERSASRNASRSARNASRSASRSGGSVGKMAEEIPAAEKVPASV